MYYTKAELIARPELPPADDPDRDGWKADALAELRAIEKLNEDIDQLAADAREVEIPEARKLLDLAWWFTEREIRETRQSCSAGHDPRKKKTYCACCAHYDELTTLARRVGAIL